MNKFIECSDEIETVVGEGIYIESGQFIHVVTSDNIVANLFEKRLEDKLIVKKLSFKKESGKAVFSGPFMVKDCDGSAVGEWNIKLKKTLRR